MYVIEAKIKIGDAQATAELRCRSEWKATKLAAQAANDGYIYENNPELSKDERYHKVESVRVYDTKNPDIGIDF